MGLPPESVNLGVGGRHFDGGRRSGSRGMIVFLVPVESRNGEGACLRCYANFEELCMECDGSYLCFTPCLVTPDLMTSVHTPLMQ